MIFLLLLTKQKNGYNEIRHLAARLERFEQEDKECRHLW